MTQPPARMSSWISKIGDVVRIPKMASRNGGHGGTAWSLPFAEAAEAGMMQPQDGAVDTRTRLANISSHQHSDGLHEPEDARLTGGTRSLDRRLLGLNVLNTYVKRSAAAVKPVARIEVA